jgi:regulator of ribonuclease activity A
VGVRQYGPMDESSSATADICDEHDAEVQVLDGVFSPLGGRTTMAGRAVTLKLFEDNTLVRDAVGEPGEGKVLVIDAGGSLRRAVLGDNLAATAAANGWSGILVYGAVRDRAILATIDLAVHALGTNPRRTEKRGQGDRDVAVSFAGATIRPGDWVVADADGVVVSPRPL